MGPGDLPWQSAARDHAMSRVVELTRDLLRFDTVNPPGNEGPANNHLGEYLAARGIAVEYQGIGDDRTNLIARLAGSGDEHLVLCGHMDVVHPGVGAWEHDPFAATIVDGRLIGRGAADMKGGVAAMAEALVELADEGFRPAGDLILAVTAGEEVNMVGAKLLESTGIVAGASNLVIGEPTGLDVFHAEKGVIWPRIIAQGRTAHGAMPHLGVNAISFMARVITRLEAYPFPYERNDVLGSPTLSVNVIDGGVKTNVVADRCMIEVDMRLVPGQSREQILEGLEEILRDVIREVPVTVEVEILQDAPAVETAAESPLLAAGVGAVREVTGREPRVGGVGYATDGAFIAPALGADMIIVGPGGVDQLHQPNEWVAVSQLEEAVKVYKAIAREVLGS